MLSIIYLRRTSDCEVTVIVLYLLSVTLIPNTYIIVRVSVGALFSVRSIQVHVKFNTPFSLRNFKYCTVWSYFHVLGRGYITV